MNGVGHAVFYESGRLGPCILGVYLFTPTADTSIGDIILGTSGVHDRTHAGRSQATRRFVLAERLIPAHLRTGVY